MNISMCKLFLTVYPTLDTLPQLTKVYQFSKGKITIKTYFPVKYRLTNGNGSTCNKYMLIIHLV